MFSRSTLRNHFLFLVLVSKHEIDRKVFPFSSRKMRFSFKFLEKKRHIILRNFEKLTALFWKYQSIIINVIPENSRENCLYLDSRSRIKARDWKKRNFRSRLEARDGKREILVLVLKHETERKKFPISSRNTRLKESNSHSRLEIWNRPLVGHCYMAGRLTGKKINHTRLLGKHPWKGRSVYLGIAR